MTIPVVIVECGEDWTAVWMDHVQNGTGIATADKTRYLHPEIETSIVAETSEKCVNCESKVTDTYPGDVEHILPKRRRPDLCVQWDNLTLACRTYSAKQIILGWLDGSEISDHEEAMQLAWAFRNATAHGYLSPTKVLEWDLCPALERLTRHVCKVVRRSDKR